MTFLEYQNWGLNALTVSFFLSLFVTAVSGWGLIQQNRTLWKLRTAEGVAVPWMAYYGILYVAIFIYGLSLASLALILNGLLAMFYAPILAGLKRFKGFTGRDTVLITGFLAAILAMIVLPYKPTFFFAFAIGGLISAALQPLEMIRKKSAEGLSIRLIGTILFGNAVWFGYGLAAGDWVLIAVNAIAFAIFGTTAGLWWRYRSHVDKLT